MKKLFFLILSIVLFQSCTSQTYIEKGALDKLIDQQEFTFMAERAVPTNYDVINVMNSIPNSTSSRIMDLSYGYSVVMKDTEMEVVLPYFGRTYNPSLNSDKNSLRFTSKDFSVSKKTGKKGNILLTVKPNDVTHIEALYFDISEKGKTYLSVNANDRSPINFDGYIMKNETAK